MLSDEFYAICKNKSFLKLNTLFEINVPASGWIASAPYTQTVSVEGMSQFFNPSYAPDIEDSTSADSEKAIKKACGFISKFETLDGAIKLTCKAKKPTVDIPLMIKVV